MGITHKSPRQSDLLPLTTAQLSAILQILKPAPKHRLITLRESLNYSVGSALARGTHDQFLMLDLVHSPYTDILTGSHIVVHIILEDHANLFTQFPQIVFFYIATTHHDFTF